MSPSLSINTLCLKPDTLAAQVDAVVRLGVDCIAPGQEQIATMGANPSARLFRDAGLSVGLLTHRAFGFATSAEAAAQRTRLNATIDLAHAIGAPAVCMTTGGRGELSWPEAAQRFAAELAPCVEYARAAGLVLGLEPTSHLYADASIAHRLSDVVALARAAGISAGIDLFACWVDADIDEAIAAAGPICAFVQVSDYVLGDRGLPCRAVPGDGAIPLDRLIQRILATGYRGVFDLEIIGPRLDAEGHDAGLRRAITYLRHALDRSLRTEEI
jgi:sugar phosphate isomerase/epimerase